MKASSFFILCLFGAFLFQSCTQSPQKIVREVDFNSDWKFIRSDVDNGQEVSLVDSDLRTVDLPPWPWFSANCGDIDILGNKKPQGVYKDVVWGNSNLELAVHEPIPNGMFEHKRDWGWPNEEQSWNWEGSEGIPLNIAVYSNYDEVRLELNGNVMGTARVSEDTRLTANFTVPYEAGELTVIGLTDGKEVGEKSLYTTGKSYQLRIIPEIKIIEASKNELAYFNIEVLDEQGLIVPYAEIPVVFNIQGKCKLQAVGNGNPIGMKSFQQPYIKTYKGRCQLIVRSCENEGKIIVSAKSEGLVEGVAEVEVKK